MNINDVYNDIISDSVKDIILDTDTYNEVDDQFAVAYAMLSGKINLLSLNAAPFHNDRSSSPEDGMEKSYNELINITNLTNPNHNIPIYRGAKNYLPDISTPVDSPAVDNIINTALNSEKPIYVVAIGAITNVASAIIKCPDIINKIIVVWLGGHAWDSIYRNEFNMVQDVPAAQVVFDSGVPFVQIPAEGVSSALTITIPDLECYINGKNKLCSYLTDIVKGYTNDTYCWTKVIWDISAIACLTMPHGMERLIMPTQKLNLDTSYSPNTTGNTMIYVRRIHRDGVFRELFDLLTSIKD